VLHVPRDSPSALPAILNGSGINDQLRVNTEQLDHANSFMEAVLPFERLRPLLRGALGSDGASGEVSVDAVNRRGRQVMVRVACTPLHNYADGLDGDGAIIVMEADAGPSPERV
jgi:hypothetical protein